MNVNYDSMWSAEGAALLPSTLSGECVGAARRDFSIFRHWDFTALTTKTALCIKQVCVTGTMYYCAYLQSCILHEQFNTFIVLAWLGFVSRFAGKTDVVKMHVGLPPDITFPLRWMSVGTNKDETVEINDANKVRKKPSGFKTSVSLQTHQRMYQWVKMYI